MDTRTEREILAAHADRLNAGLRGEAAYPEIPRGQESLILPLLQLAELLVQVFVPVEPSPVFVQKLGQELAQAAAWSQLSLLQRYRKAIVLTVATLGSAFSVIGLILLYMFRQRNKSAPIPVGETH